jgi:hypothetical protein
MVFFLELRYALLGSSLSQFFKKEKPPEKTSIDSKAVKKMLNPAFCKSIPHAKPTGM